MKCLTDAVSTQVRVFVRDVLFLEKLGTNWPTRFFSFCVIIIGWGEKRRISLESQCSIWNVNVEVRGRLFLDRRRLAISVEEGSRLVCVVGRGKERGLFGFKWWRNGK